MIIVDASVLIPLLMEYQEESDDIEKAMQRMGWEPLGAPHVIDLEVAHTVRRLLRAERINERVASGALSGIMEMRLSRFPHDLLLPRIWQLRHDLSAYDAAYLALAETLEAPLVTRDRTLAIPDTTAEVVVIG
ncbi:MAG: type II toxin-antitoxin system VapC family toxin [Acidimicrobiia bacterium]